MAESLLEEVKSNTLLITVLFIYMISQKKKRPRKHTIIGFDAANVKTGIVFS